MFHMQMSFGKPLVPHRLQIAEPYPHGHEGPTRCSAGRLQCLTSLSERRRNYSFKWSCQARLHVLAQVAKRLPVHPVQVLNAGFMNAAPCVVPLFSDALPLVLAGVGGYFSSAVAAIRKLPPLADGVEMFSLLSL